MTIVGVAWTLSDALGIAAIPAAYVAGTAVKALLLAVFVRRRLRLLAGRPASGATSAPS
jgi:hypothetical protein